MTKERSEVERFDAIFDTLNGLEEMEPVETGMPDIGLKRKEGTRTTPWLDGRLPIAEAVRFVIFSSQNTDQKGKPMYSESVTVFTDPEKPGEYLHLKRKELLFQENAGSVGEKERQDKSKLKLETLERLVNVALSAE